MISGTVRRLTYSRYWLSLSLLTAAIAFSPQVRAQETPESDNRDRPQAPQVINPSTLRPLSSETSFLSFQGAERLLGRASEAISADNYDRAAQHYREARQIFNQLSKFHEGLYNDFTGIDNRIAESHRTKAVDAAQKRDEATYQLALVHMARSQPELAIPLLVQAIESQNPTRELGTQSYQQLLALGFVDLPYPKPQESESESGETEGAEAVEASNTTAIEAAESPAPPSLLSFEGGERLMQDAAAAVSAQDYEQATQKLREARQVFNRLSNLYQQLAGSFSGIDNPIADQQRQNALDAAQWRDDATYQLALVHRAQNQPELAVPLLIQVIRSQNPTRDRGKDAYRQLFELGFVDTPYPPNRDRQSSSR
jgi:flagellin-specific chaperone FliS